MQLFTQQHHINLVLKKVYKLKIKLITNILFKFWIHKSLTCSEWWNLSLSQGYFNSFFFGFCNSYKKEITQTCSVFWKWTCSIFLSIDLNFTLLFLFIHQSVSTLKSSLWQILQYKDICISLDSTYWYHLQAT